MGKPASGKGIKPEAPNAAKRAVTKSGEAATIAAGNTGPPTGLGVRRGRDGMVGTFRGVEGRDTREGGRD
jgi:hypothetical protein